MIHQSSCVICGLPAGDIRRGFVAPFVASRVWGRPPFAVELRHCRKCEFLFFSPRLEPFEEELLYQQYRGESYVAMRHATEPWYTDRLNASLSAAEVFASRCSAVRAVFARAGLLQSVRTVLDFGGNRGELVSGVFPDAEKYVYDISQVEPMAGVSRVTLADCANVTFDLIICSNVLEHVAAPKVLADQIAAVANPGCLIFLEVPCESPLESVTRLKRVVQGVLLLMMRPRTFLSVAPFRSLNVMHEHLNFFTPRALQSLADEMGWALVDRGSYGKRTALMIWSLLRA